MSKYLFFHKDYLSEQDLIGIYERIASDPVLTKTLWYDGAPAGPHSWLKRTKDWWMAQGRTEYGTPVGVFWLNGFTGKTAQMHFCIYPERHAEAVDIGRAAMDWLDSLGWLKSVVGITPVTHRHVMPYIQALGFQVIGKVPGACYIERRDKYVDAHISVYTFGGNNQ